MAGIGPISIDDFEKLKVLAVHKFLKENLGYIEEEITNLSIVETRMAKKGEKIIYVAFEDHDHICELHMRQEESQNDRIIIRNYIPPNFHSRFMFLNRVCAFRRAEEI